jgi:hypothetical protein
MDLRIFSNCVRSLNLRCSRISFLAKCPETVTRQVEFFFFFACSLSGVIRAGHDPPVALIGQSTHPYKAGAAALQQSDDVRVYMVLQRCACTPRVAVFVDASSTWFLIACASAFPYACVSLPCCGDAAGWRLALVYT